MAIRFRQMTIIFLLLHCVTTPAFGKGKNSHRVKGERIFLIEPYRVRNFRGRVSYFNQSEARKHCFLASDWHFATDDERVPT